MSERRPYVHPLSHGLLSQQVLLPGEDGEALRELGERLRAELQPVGELEELLVDRATAAYWRLLRADHVEVGIFAWERSEELAKREQQREARRYEWSALDDLIDASDETKISDMKKHEEALSRTRRMRSEQESETATLERIFVRDADKVNAFSKLSRYESAIERQLYRALHELERH